MLYIFFDSLKKIRSNLKFGSFDEILNILFPATKGFDFCNGKEDKDNAMTMDEVEAAFVDDVKQVCRKWRKRIESKVNHKPCGEAKV